MRVFRSVFYLGLLVHFLPSFLWFSENYGADAFRAPAWGESLLFSAFSSLPQALVIALAAVTVAACVAGTLGILPRVCAAVALAGTYAFVCFNSLHTFALVLIDAWAVLLIWVIWGEGSTARALIVAQVTLGFFFSGVHKLLMGWPAGNEMHLLLSLPPGLVTRDWVARSGWLRSDALDLALTVAALLVELGAPLLVLWRRTRLAGVAILAAFMTTILAMLQIPPLFWAIYVGGLCLALDDSLLLRFVESPRGATSRKRAGGRHPPRAKARA